MTPEELADKAEVEHVTEEGAGLGMFGGYEWFLHEAGGHVTHGQFLGLIEGWGVVRYIGGEGDGTILAPIRFIALRTFDGMTLFSRREELQAAWDKIVAESEKEAVKEAKPPSRQARRRAEREASKA